MDLLSLLKQANIFSPTGQMNQQQFPVGSIGGPVDQSPMQQQTGGLDLNAAIQGLLNPSNQQFNNYQQMIQQMPQRQDYQPDLLRRIGATLAGMGTGSPVGISGGAVLGYKSDIPTGLKVQNAIRDEPYDRVLYDWTQKLEPTGKAAQMESTRNTSERVGGLGILRQKAADDKLAESMRQADIKNENADLDRNIREMRAEVYKWKAEHPNSEIKQDDDGYLIGIDPASNRVTYITDPSGQPVKGDKMPEADRVNLQIQGQKDVTKLRGDISAKNTATRQATSLTNAQTLETGRQVNRIQLQELKSKLTKSLSPSATRQDRINKAMEIINARPELKEYFVHNTGGNVTGELNVPDKGDEQELEFIRDQMGASNTTLPAQTPQSNATPARELERPVTMPSAARIAQARKKVEPGYVLITDGNSFGSVIAADVNKIPKGWMEVK